MLLDLDFIPKNLDGSAIGDESTAKILANAMAFAKTETPLKMFNIAQELYLKGKIDIDIDDLKLIKDFIEKEAPFLNILKAIILKEIEKITH